MPKPLTFNKSSTDLKGRAAIIVWARFLPIPVTSDNSFKVALLTFTLPSAGNSLTLRGFLTLSFDGLETPETLVDLVTLVALVALIALTFLTLMPTLGLTKGEGVGTGAGTAAGPTTGEVKAPAFVCSFVGVTTGEGGVTLVLNTRESCEPWLEELVGLVESVESVESVVEEGAGLEHPERLTNKRATKDTENNEEADRYFAKGGNNVFIHRVITQNKIPSRNKLTLKNSIVL